MLPFSPMFSMFLSNPLELGAVYVYIRSDIVGRYSADVSLTDQHREVPSNQSAITASMRLSKRPSFVQMPTTFNPADKSNSRHCTSVRSRDCARAIMYKSKDVISQEAPISGTTFSFISTFEYPFIIAGTMCCKMRLQSSSGQSCRTACKK